MFAACGRVQQVDDLNPLQDQIVREQGSVAAGRIPLCAHHRQAGSGRQTHQVGGAGAEGLRFHMIGVAAQPILLERDVAGVTPRATHAAQLAAGPMIGKITRVQRVAQGWVVKMWPATGCRMCPHIHERDDTGIGDQPDQRLEAAIAVSDGVEREPEHGFFVCAHDESGIMRHTKCETGGISAMVYRFLSRVFAVLLLVAPVLQAADVSEWDTDFGRMYINELGAPQFAATYEFNSGRVFGRLYQRRFEGTWVQGRSSERCRKRVAGSRYWGRAEFVFDRSLTQFQGRWSYCGGPMDGKWSGQLAERETKAPPPARPLTRCEQYPLGCGPGYTAERLRGIDCGGRTQVGCLCWKKLGSKADRKSTRLNSSHTDISRMPSSA